MTLSDLKRRMERALTKSLTVPGLEQNVPVPGTSETVDFNFWYDSQERLIVLNVVTEATPEAVERIIAATEALEAKWEAEGAGGFSLAALALPEAAGKPQIEGVEVWRVMTTGGMVVYGFAKE
jgi:hypothetical protein